MFELNKTQEGKICNGVNRIGLISGNGKFPFFLCDIAKRQNIDTVIIAINGETEPKIANIKDKLYWIELGQGKRLIDILKKENLAYVIIGGKIKKTTILKQTFKMDEVARSIFKNIIDRRDNTIFKAIENKLKGEGITLLDPSQLLGNLLAKKGVYTKKDLTLPQKEDIAFGFKLAKAIGGLDIGQTVVVKDKSIIAVEAIEGTDEAILRAGTLSPETVVVKVSKPDQDMRFDIPTVGLHTIISMKKAGASVLAVEAEKTLMLEKEAMIKEADSSGICIVAV